MSYCNPNRIAPWDEGFNAGAVQWGHASWNQLSHQAGRTARQLRGL
jgi:hypothetical protein